MSGFGSSDFKKLKKKWYDKLSESGFEDIEQEDGNLKIWSSLVFKIRCDDVTFEAKQTYYRRATQFLHEHKFESKIDKQIWQAHCEGVSRRNIVKKYNVQEHKVRTTIENCSNLMKEVIRQEDGTGTED